MRNRARQRYLTSTAVASRLHKFWWEDRPPHWTINKGKPFQGPCQTAAEASDARLRCVGVCRRYAKYDPAAKDVANELDGCSPRRRCWDGACPECNRALQRLFVIAGPRLIKRWNRKHPDNPGWREVTLIPDYGRCKIGNLHKLNVDAIWLRTKRRLQKLGVTLAFGGIDFSVNIDAKGATPIVQVHFTLFIPDSQWPNPDTKTIQELFNKKS